MPNNRKRQNIGIFIDEANIYHSQKTLGWKVDYLKLKEHFEKIGKIKVLNFYTSFMDKNIYQKDRFNKLQKNGFKIIKKQLKFIKTMSGLIIKKGNLDIELALDAYIEKNNYNILVLFSGDSDFEYLLKILKDKYIIIVSTRKHISKELLNVSDEYIDLKKLTDNIRIKESQH